MSYPVSGQVLFFIDPVLTKKHADQGLHDFQFQDQFKICVYTSMLGHLY